MRITDSKSSSDLQQLSAEVFAVLSKVYFLSPWSQTQIISDLKKAEVNYYLIYDDEHLVAFLATQTIIDELEITNLAVLPAYQQQGLATQLLKKLDTFIGTIFLEVRESNQPARALYDKFGFHVFNRRKEYYAHPTEDALMMKRKGTPDQGTFSL